MSGSPGVYFCEENLRSLTAERRAKRGREGGEESEEKERERKGEKEKIKKVPCVSAHLSDADCSLSRRRRRYFH
jgi:hypothetical protein